MISLDDMSELARRLVQSESNTAQAEKELSRAKERERILREETIPSAMQELGLEKLVLSTGETITVKQDVYASVPKDGKERAYAWLEEHDFGGLIKTAVTVQFGKGEDEKAVELYERLVAEGLVVEADREVNAQTLKAFLREQLAAAKEIPLDIFGARPVWVAKVVNKK